MTPILNASGCLDALVAPEIARQLDAFVTKTVTPEPREGNPPPRIAEVEGGMLNSIGLQNPGIQTFVDRNLPHLAALGVPIWVSVGGFSAADYADSCRRLDDEAAVAVIELNLSCPNVEEAPETAAELVAAARAAELRVHDGGTYVNMEGPQFSTRAESRLYRSFGADVIGMTNLQEAKLAREAEICYGTLALVTDYDCWHPSHGAVDIQMVIANLNANARHAQELIRRALPDVAASRLAVITAPEKRPPATVARLKGIIEGV